MFFVIQFFTAALKKYVLTLILTNWYSANSLGISDWCAKYYEHTDFNGWEKVVGEISQFDLTGNENNQATSVRVKPGCTLKLFKDHKNVGLLYSLTADVLFLSAYNDQVSSLSCTCQGTKPKTNTFNFTLCIHIFHCSISFLRCFDN